jgi:hypothetical protein
MASLLWKGLQLESTYGSARYALLVLELWLSSSLLMCGIIWGAYTHFSGVIPGMAAQYYSTCTVGFSAVLFGMKAVISAGETGWQSVVVPGLGSVSMPPKVRSDAAVLRLRFGTPLFDTSLAIRTFWPALASCHRLRHVILTHQEHQACTQLMRSLDEKTGYHVVAVCHASWIGSTEHSVGTLIVCSNKFTDLLESTSCISR